jgi:hypothetical protein
MLAFKTILQKFDSKGEKTGWTYIDIPKDILVKLKLKDKKGFRVKGVIDNTAFEKLSTYPIGEGDFVIAINGDFRKQLGKKEGAMVSVKLALDAATALQSQELLDCLADDKVALKAFNALLLSHRNYHHRYVTTAKTAATRAGRIVNVINALHKGQNFGEMIRSLKAGK